MSSIKIKVAGVEVESIVIELSAEEVTALYESRKENQQTIAALEKQIKDVESNKKYVQDRADKAESELSQAHILMSALGIQEKTDNEEPYYRKELNLSTRIALFIAKS